MKTKLKFKILENIKNVGLVQTTTTIKIKMLFNQ